MRKKVIKCSMYLIFPILFNVMFFMLGGTEHPASVWLSYAWIHAAYILMIATPLFSRRTQSATIFQFTISQISSAYFGIEFIIGLIFIFVGTEGIKAPIIVQFIPCCLFLLVFLWNLLFNEHTADNEKRRILEVSFIKTASSKAKILMDSVSDTKMKNRIEKVYDLIHSSPSKSYASVKELENSVMMLLNELNIALDENNYDESNRIIRKIQFNMEERNRIVMLSN